MAGHINQVREMSLPARVTELVRGLRPAFDLARRDLLTFAEFLDDLSTADEESGGE